MLLLTNNIRITHALTIFRVIIKIGILVHFYKTHTKKCGFFLDIEGCKSLNDDYQTTTNWNGKAVSVTALVFTENAEDKLQRLQWINGSLDHLHLQASLHHNGL